MEPCIGAIVGNILKAEVKNKVVLDAALAMDSAPACPTATTTTPSTSAVSMTNRGT